MKNFYEGSLMKFQLYSIFILIVHVSSSYPHVENVSLVTFFFCVCQSLRKNRTGLNLIPHKEEYHEETLTRLLN